MAYVRAYARQHTYKTAELSRRTFVRPQFVIFACTNLYVEVQRYPSRVPRVSHTLASEKSVFARIKIGRLRTFEPRNFVTAACTVDTVAVAAQWSVVAVPASS